MASGVSDTALVAEVERSVVECFSLFGRTEGGELYEDGGLTWICSLPFPPYSGVLESRLSEAAIRDALERIDLFYRIRRAQYFWLVGPSASPPSLRPLLRGRGFHVGEPLTGMAADIGGLARPGKLPRGCEIREVRDPVSRRSYLRLQVERWAVPEAYVDRLARMDAYSDAHPEETRRWLAYRDEVPVGKVFLHLGSRAASVYGVAVVPEARGLGLGTALTLTAFEAAAQAGHDLAVLHSSDIAFGMYVRMGFRALCELEPFIEPREGSVAAAP